MEALVFIGIYGKGKFHPEQRLGYETIGVFTRCASKPVLIASAHPAAPDSVNETARAKISTRISTGT